MSPKYGVRVTLKLAHGSRVSVRCHGPGTAGTSVACAGAAKTASRNPATTQPGLGVDLLRMNGPGVAASPARVVDGIVTPPFRSLQRRRDLGGYAVSLEVTEEKGSRVPGFKGPRVSDCESNAGTPADSDSNP